jgi:hypothetical protein
MIFHRSTVVSEVRFKEGIRMSGQSVKVLKLLTGAIGIGAGAALWMLPAVSAALLFDEKLESRVDLLMVRFSGAGLLALGMVCQIANFDPNSPSSQRLVAAMLFYYIVVVGVLGFALLTLRLHGLALWPVIVVHAAMGIWCIFAMTSRSDASSYR